MPGFIHEEGSFGVFIFVTVVLGGGYFVWLLIAEGRRR